MTLEKNKIRVYGTVPVLDYRTISIKETEGMKILTIKLATDEESHRYAPFEELLQHKICTTGIQ